MDVVEVRGRFVWHQLLTRDVPAARAFYSRIVGWNAHAWPLDPQYIVCQAGDAPTAGLQPMNAEMPAEAPPHWLAYIGTRDVDGTAEAAVRAGGSILKSPADLEGAGRYAVLRDPQGAVFAIIDPENIRPEPAQTPFGGFSWHELATSDLEAAFAFYGDLFGWELLHRMDLGPSFGIYLMFGQNGVRKGGMYVKAIDDPTPPNWLPYALVPSVDASAGEVEAAGGRILRAPMEVPGGSRIIVLKDPTGAVIALNSPPAGASINAPTTEQAARAPRREATSRSKPKSKAKPKVKPKRKAKVKAKVKAKTRPKAKARGRTKSARRATPARGKTARKASSRKNTKKTRKTVRRKK